MPAILAIGSPKGGVGKSTLAILLAVIGARMLGQRVLLVDADDNRTVLDWTRSASDELMPLETADGRDLALLVQLRRAQRYDLVVVDLPGAREGAFKALLGDDSKEPVADLLVCPSAPEWIDLLPVERVLRNEVVPLGLPYVLALTLVRPEALRLAEQRRGELRERGFNTADTLVRGYVAYNEARERSMTVLDLPAGGKRSTTRQAQRDCLHLAHEVFTALPGLTVDLTPLEVAADADQAPAR